MLRELQTIVGKPASSQYSCAEDEIITGMAVVKDQATGTFGFVEAETAADLFFVDKERVPSGINAARTDMSDYDEDFVTLKNGELGKLIAYHAGERFATDQFVEGLAKGDRIAAGVDGKIKKAESTVDSKYVYVEEYVDNGHKLALIEVSDTVARNA